MSSALIRTVCCKLDVIGHDAKLATTQRAFNEAASWIAQVCWEEGITNTTTAHYRVYGETRLAYGLGAQLAVCARAKAVESIKAVKSRHRETCPQFGSRGSVRYDARTYRLISQDQASLNTLDGRIVCRLLLSARQHAMLLDPAWNVGGADLVWRRDVYYLHITQSRDFPDTPKSELHVPGGGGTLGVDLGIVNLATDSDGESVTGAQVKQVRVRYYTRRQRLQKVGTRTAKRRLRKNAGRERRFQKDVNHCISKVLVKKAVVARKALALEDLTGIRERMKKTVRRADRYERHIWSFFQLRLFITDKPAWVGVPVYLGDPKDTSRTCPRCGYVSKDNRVSQAVFVCANPNVPCGYMGHADHVGAINVAIRAWADQHWAAVNRPMASPRER